MDTVEGELRTRTHIRIQITTYFELQKSQITRSVQIAKLKISSYSLRKHDFGDEEIRIRSALIVPFVKSPMKIPPAVTTLCALIVPLADTNTTILKLLKIID